MTFPRSGLVQLEIRRTPFRMDKKIKATAKIISDALSAMIELKEVLEPEIVNENDL